MTVAVAVAVRGYHEDVKLARCWWHTMTVSVSVAVAVAMTMAVAVAVAVTVAKEDIEKM